MNLILVGGNRQLLWLLAAIGRSGQHGLDVYETGLDAATRRTALPEARLHSDWTEILSRTDVDAVLVLPGGPGERAEQLRRMAQAGLPLIAVHPACDAILGFELDMIRRDTGAVLCPLQAELLHPAVAELRTMAVPATSPIGPVQQVAVETPAGSTSERGPARLLAEDALLVHHLLGDFQQVSALTPSSADERAPELRQIQFTCAPDILGRWSTVPSEPSPGRIIRLAGQQGTATLRMLTSEPWKLETTGPRPEVRAYPDVDLGQLAVEQIERVVGGQPPAVSWEQACRALDLVETAQQSARRGKSLMLHNEPVTEEDTFKGMMAAGGCVLLLVTLLLLATVSTVEGLGLPVADSFWGRWPFALVGLLLLFLLLQLLRMVFPRPAEQVSGDRDRG
jgi:predicted dehydrogenase